VIEAEMLLNAQQRRKQNDGITLASAEKAEPSTAENCRPDDNEDCDFHIRSSGQEGDRLPKQRISARQVKRKPHHLMNSLHKPHLQTISCQAGDGLQRIELRDMSNSFSRVPRCG
jgi:hypothetical protein